MTVLFVQNKNRQHNIDNPMALLLDQWYQGDRKRTKSVIFITGLFFKLSNVNPAMNIINLDIRI